MGTDATPPPKGLPSRLILGPVLRAQPDRRLVRLVREGHEGAFEEIVRRYRRPLDRFASSFVGVHADDVTQESFRKALVALRRAEADVDLRPWLFRIVRNTALTDLRDQPPAATQLAEELIAGTVSVAAVAEQRAELEDLVARLRELPENQRAALVMRELEGMSHEEIAATLGVSGGAARQAIARARAAVRAGFGALVPLPLLRALAAGDGTGAVAGAGTGAAVAGSGAIGTVGLKAAVATLVVAGAVGAGVAIEHGGGSGKASRGAQASILRSPSKDATAARPSPAAASARADRKGPTVGARRASHARSAAGRSDHHTAPRQPDNRGPHLLLAAPASPVDAGGTTPVAEQAGAPAGHHGGGSETAGGATGNDGGRQSGDREGSREGSDGPSSSGDETRQGTDGGGGSSSSEGGGGSGPMIEGDHETATGESGSSDDPGPTLLSADPGSTSDDSAITSPPEPEPSAPSPTPESDGAGGGGGTESTDGSGSS
ncbi:MAG: sigma-70 family RNA polymerase sigma factor [Actinobacteria bacterium]|nr:sigma-70 family RNA polymerase sigma factor [Actinomycetota bacterium]